MTKNYDSILDRDYRLLCYSKVSRLAIRLTWAPIEWVQYYTIVLCTGIYFIKYKFRYI